MCLRLVLSVKSLDLDVVKLSTGMTNLFLVCMVVYAYGRSLLTVSDLNKWKSSIGTDFLVSYCSKIRRLRLWPVERGVHEGIFVSEFDIT